MENLTQQQEGPQSFELLELLFRDAPNKPDPSNVSNLRDFESFQSRFQSFIDQIPKIKDATAAPGKSGFFTHFFLGSFSTILDTKLNKEKIGINSIYYLFDSAKTLKIVAETAKKTHVFIFTEETAEKYSKSKEKKISKFEFTKEELNNINTIRKKSNQDELKDTIEIKLVEIDISKNVRVIENKKILNKDVTLPIKSSFKAIAGQRVSDNHLENDIEKLSEMNTESVETTFREILEYVKNIHTALNLSDNVYGIEAREANHHGFLAGVLNNFRYRYNTRIYLELFSGRGSTDIILLVRGDNRSTHSIPIIIELKAGKSIGREPDKARQEAEDYALGFRPNTARVLTFSDNVICVGFNLDYTPTNFINKMLNEIDKIINNHHLVVTDETLKKSLKDKLSEFIEMQDSHLIKIIDDWNWNKDSLNSKIKEHLKLTFNSKIIQQETENLQPTTIEILASTKKWFNTVIDCDTLKEEIQNTLERIYNTFPGTPEKSENHYFSRFLLGESLLINNFDYQKYIFIYEEIIKTKEPNKLKETERSSKKTATINIQKSGTVKYDDSHAITTTLFIPSNTEEPVCLLNIIESNKNLEIKNINLSDEEIKKIIGNRKINKLNLHFNIDKKEKHFSEFCKLVSIDQYNSIDNYNQKNSSCFSGKFKEIPYPEGFKESFDNALNSQKKNSNLNNFIESYKKLFEQDIEKSINPFKSIIEKEAHSQAILHGAFNHYSDLKLSEAPETRAVVLTEFQTGKGKRIDMLIHGIGPSLDPKEYKPTGLEIKGPRKNKTAEALMREAKKQINEDYKTGFYKGLTDGDQAYILPVIVDLGNKMITLGETSEAIVSHSSVTFFKKITEPSTGNLTEGISSMDTDSNTSSLASQPEVLIEIKKLDLAADLAPI